MKKQRWLFLLILWLPFLVIGQDSLKTARITFDEKEYDFKTVPQGVVAEHVFHFKNTGRDTLRILKVRPG